MERTSGLTYADLQAFPEDGLRREIIDGELYVSASPYLRHQRLLSYLNDEFRAHLKAYGGGVVYFAPADVVLSDHNVVEPDLVFIAEPQRSIETEANIQGVPALLVEVLSDARRDRVIKRALYERFGVPEYVIVDQESDWVEVYRMTDRGYGKPALFMPGDELTFDAIPGLRISVAELFDR